MRIPSTWPLIMAMFVCLPVFGQPVGPAAPDAEPARALPPVPLDMSDPGKAQRQLDAMSADEVALYLTDPKTPQFHWAMAALRKKGESAIPHLAKLMGRNDLGHGWTNPGLDLLELGDKSLPTLVDLLRSDNPAARRHASWTLMKRTSHRRTPFLRLSKCCKAKTDLLPVMRHLR